MRIALVCKCGESYDNWLDSFCYACGVALLDPTCPKCKEEVRGFWQHCAYCGAELAGRVKVA